VKLKQWVLLGKYHRAYWQIQTNEGWDSYHISLRNDLRTKMGTPFRTAAAKVAAEKTGPIAWGTACQQWLAGLAVEAGGMAGANRWWIELRRNTWRIELRQKLPIVQHLQETRCNS
jgi:hypothetical protein